MVSIPIINGVSTEKNRWDFIRYFEQAKVDRVFVFVDNPFEDKEALAEAMALLRENLAFYANPVAPDGTVHPGYEVAVWINGFGHGGALAHDKAEKSGNYTKLRGLCNGGEAGDSFCPLDPDYRQMYANFVTEVAKAGAPMIMIDDDLRMAGHGPCQVACACDLHMALFNERARAAGLADHDYTREELATFLFNGPATPLRKVWLDLMGDTMRDFARDMRKAVDAVDDTIRLGHCACLSTWDLDGVDSIELARIFAGNTRPFLRLIGAAYWNSFGAFRNVNLGSIINLIRMQTAWCQEIAPEMEIMSEGDVYPRPRFNVPASFLEAYHQVLTADHMPDILKYMLDYGFDPNYETGYIRLHAEKEIFRAQLTDAFADTEGAGIYVYEAMHKMADMDCTGMSEGELFARFTPASVNYTSCLGLPSSYTRTKYTPTTLIFGENAKYATTDILDADLILDGLAARILHERGVDIGLVSLADMAHPAEETLGDCPARTYPVDTAGRFWQMHVREGAVVLGTYDNGAPAVYSYVNSKGKKILVYAFDMESVNFASVYMKNEYRRWQVLHQQGDNLPAIVPERGLYVLCRQSETKLAVGMWNFALDIGLPQDKIRLNATYKTILPIGNASVCGMGNRAAYLEDIPPFCGGGFVMKK